METLNLMKKLNWPAVSGKMPGARRMSMDEYLEFVESNLALLGKKKNRSKKQQPLVLIPFCLAA